MLQAIWTHRTNIVSNGDRCNPGLVLELAKDINYEDRDYKNYTNLPYVSQVARSNNLRVGKIFNQSWSSSQAGWTKFNTDSSKN